MRKVWDLETDVVVAGYGLAGAVAAVEAKDAGAEVVIVEKSQYPGGSSILAGGSIKGVDDAEEARQYLTVLSGGRMEDDLIAVFAEGLADNQAYVRKLAAIDGGEVKRVPSREGIYPFPGRDTFYSFRIAKIPGFGGFPWMRSYLNPAGVNMIKVVLDNVEARGIEARFSSPARRLETDETGAVVGVVAESDGREVAIRARRAVILATGGFEQNEWLRKQYLHGMPFYSMAPLTHTGDGIVMSQKVGAALWHMWHVHGSYGFKTPESPIAYRHPFSGYRNPKRRMAWIVVDQFGSRYMNECPPAPQDTGHRPMDLFDADIPGFPRIPSYAIFDEEGRRLGPIAKPLAFPGCEYDWSEDNRTEIDKGWIVRADTIPELAAAIAERCPHDEGRIDARRLETTVRAWNGCVETGADPLNRPPGTMMSIKKPPFYAVEVWPVITNTQGGPVHNTKQQVIDALGQPIPRLYAVGELGSFFGHLYQLGGNLAECFISGRIAGPNAAAETSR